MDRVVRHLEQSGKKVSVLAHQTDVISSLPSALRAEIIHETHAEIIQKVRLLQGKNTEFVWQFLHMLEP